MAAKIQKTLKKMKFAKKPQRIKKELLLKILENYLCKEGLMCGCRKGNRNISLGGNRRSSSNPQRTTSSLRQQAISLAQVQNAGSSTGKVSAANKATQLRKNAIARTLGR